MQQVVVTDTDKKHIEVGVYEEAETSQHLPVPKKKSEAVTRSLHQLDEEIDKELKEQDNWKHQMFKDFKDPSCPTLIELLEKCIEILENINKLEETLLHYYKEERITGLLTTLFGVLRNLTRQFDMLTEILKSKGTPEEITEIHNKHADLNNLTMLIHSKAQICWKVLSQCLSYHLKNLLLDLHKTVDHLFEKKGVISDASKVNEIQIITGKIRVVSEYLPLAAIFDQNDIFALEEDHPYLKELSKVVQVKSLGPSEKIKRSNQRLIRGIQTGVSMMSKRAEMDSVIAKKLTFSFGAMYYYLSSAEAKHQANLFYSQPKVATAFQTWNIFEDELVAAMMKISLPSIKYSKRAYINRVYDPITLELLNGARANGTLNSLAPLDYSTEPRLYSEEVTTLTYRKILTSEIKLKGDNKIPVRVISNKALSIRKYTELEISQRQTSNGAVETTIANERHIENPVGSENQRETETYDKPGDRLMCGLMGMFRGLGCFGDKIDYGQRIDPCFDGLIIHIHGGGFVSMSSASHQSYTRQWSKLLNKTVLSIDYRLAPEHPYPAALDDCWQSYNWILNYAEEVLGIRPSKIILTGDSAGANLALGITVLAMKCGVRLPDGLMLAYPALRMEEKAFSPSLMLALEDQLVPYSLLKLCIQSYVPENADPARDPFISPIHFADEILEQLPPVRMMVGDSDPLHDECWRFADKLRKLNKDVYLTVYKDMCHGFLGYDLPMGMPESKVCIQDSAAMIAELFRKATYHYN